MSEARKWDSISATVGGVLRRPRPTFNLAVQEGRIAPGLTAVAGAGLAWAGFCALLWSRGHAPSFTGNPIPAADYYGFQALFITPLLLLGWLLLSGAAHGTARLLGGRGSWSSTSAVTGLSYGLPILLAFVVPDLVAYVFGGFEALAPVLRLSAPACALWMLALTSLALQAAHGLTGPRSLVAAVAGILAQGVLVGAFAR